jgi:hypothetical protein
MKNAELYRRLVAVLFGVGGLAGLTVFVLERTPVSGEAVHDRWRNSSLMYMFIFGSCTWTDVELWRGSHGH